jgi:hypothetical protein
VSIESTAEALTWQSALAYITTPLFGVFWWVVRGYAKDVKMLKEHAVTRKELAEALAASDARALVETQRQMQMHSSTVEALREIRGQLEGVNLKLFNLALVKAPPNESR